MIQSPSTQQSTDYTEIPPRKRARTNSQSEVSSGRQTAATVASQNQSTNPPRVPSNSSSSSSIIGTPCIPMISPTGNPQLLDMGLFVKKTDHDIKYLLKKIAHYEAFDLESKMNLLESSVDTRLHAMNKRLERLESSGVFFSKQIKELGERVDSYKGLESIPDKLERLEERIAAYAREKLAAECKMLRDEKKRTTATHKSLSMQIRRIERKLEEREINDYDRRLDEMDRLEEKTMQDHEELENVEMLSDDKEDQETRISEMEKEEDKFIVSATAQYPKSSIHRILS